MTYSIYLTLAVCWGVKRLRQVSAFVARAMAGRRAEAQAARGQHRPVLSVGRDGILIVCRNVLIYFDEATRRRLCEQFHALLTEGGWLLLGSAENLYGVTERFESVRLGETLIYGKA